MSQSGPPPHSDQPDPRVSGQPQPPPRPQSPPPPPPYHAPPPPPPPPPPPGYGPGMYPPPPPRPQTVHITSKPGGFARAFGFIFGLMIIGVVFVGGIFVGIVAMFASSSGGQVILEEGYQSGSSRQRIAIIPVEGIIDQYMAEFVRDATDHVLDDDNRIAAVILRVNSPGGGVTSSDQIWYEMKRVTDSGRPVVASYGGIAASGGYYVSCNTDHIMAEPTCITGSIGVIAQVFTFENMMDKVGIEPITLVASNSPEKDIANDIFHEWTERDREKILEMLDASYETFFKRVADGRKNVISDKAKLRSLADGSIYTADQALETNLIDGIGYLDDAVTYVEQNSLGITTGTAEVVTLRYPPSLFGDGLLLQAHHRASEAGRLDADRLRTLANDLASPRLMYLMQ